LSHPHVIPLKQLLSVGTQKGHRRKLWSSSAEDCTHLSFRYQLHNGSIKSAERLWPGL